MWQLGGLNVRMNAGHRKPGGDTKRSLQATTVVMLC